MDGLRPPENISVSEWSDKYRVLSSTGSAEPGRWSTDRTPYLREIQDQLNSFNPSQEIIIMKGAQLGLTECGFNVIGYHIDMDPCPMMYIMPNESTLTRNSKSRISPMIAATPRLSSKIAAARKKDSGNSIFQKDFPGGTLILAGANSGAGLRSVPIKLMIMDEVDAYPLDLNNEGSPLDLAKARTRTFAKKKIMYFSTPLIKGRSVIEQKYLETSQKRFFVPCVLCGVFQHLVFENITYEITESGKIEKAQYKCCGCDGLIDEYHKLKMFAAGEWQDTVPEKIDEKIVGYHINSLYSPLGWYSWLDAATDYEAAKKEEEKGKNAKMKTFKNTVLGLTWEEKGEVPDYEKLMGRRVEYERNTINKDVAFLTAGVDVQKERLELEVVGWCEGKITYSIDTRVIPGDTSSAAVWNKLSEVVNEIWEREDGLLMPLLGMAIDTGYNTAQVYDFCRKHPRNKVFPVKGQDKQRVIITQPRAIDHKKKARKRKHSLGDLVLYNVGVSVLKSELYGFLNLKITETGVPAGYCFFPLSYDEHYFKMLTAEELKKKEINGFDVFYWEKIRDRNEALDCRVYARAAASILGIDKFKAEHWQALRNNYAAAGDNKTNQYKKKKSSFW